MDLRVWSGPWDQELMYPIAMQNAEARASTAANPLYFMVFGLVWLNNCMYQRNGKWYCQIREVCQWTGYLSEWEQLPREKG